MQTTNIQSILFDLDGVLFTGQTPIAGAAQTIADLKKQGLKVAGCTNTTTQSSRQLQEKLHAMGIDDLETLFTPAQLARQTIGSHTAALFVRDSLREDLAGISESLDHPDYVLLGDPGGDGFDAAQLQQIFRLLMNGSRLLALHKNRHWQKEDGLHLDLGAFVAGLEYASDQQATVLGKPSKDFFLGICKALGIHAGHTLMIGDDIESDIKGAQQAGLKTALVKTGKYREAFFKRSGIKPDILIPSVADLPDALQLL